MYLLTIIYIWRYRSFLKMCSVGVLFPAFSCSNILNLKGSFLLLTLRVSYLESTLFIKVTCFLLKSSHNVFPVFRLGTHLYMSPFPSVYPSICPFIIFIIIFGALVKMLGLLKGKKQPRMKNRNQIRRESVSQEEYSIWSSFLVHLCKMMISLSIFFHFFKILIFGIVSGLKGQKIPKMPQNSVCRASYRRNHLLYDCHLWYTSVNDDITRHFFHFFKILISQI